MNDGRRAPIPDDVLHNIICNKVVVPDFAVAPMGDLGLAGLNYVD
jgi:hypothetical protein